ncbi:MAG: hypothetical protein EOO24_49800, partial [Comamonadaceae bacterium]
TLAPVTISSKAAADPVEKSYRRMLRGMDLYERERALAPRAPLRFKVLPRSMRRYDFSTGSAAALLLMVTGASVWSSCAWACADSTGASTAPAARRRVANRITRKPSRAVAPGRAGGPQRAVGRAG